MGHTRRIYNVWNDHYLYNPYKQRCRRDFYRDLTKEENTPKKILSKRRRVGDTREIREMLFNSM